MQLNLLKNLKIFIALSVLATLGCDKAKVKEPPPLSNPYKSLTVVTVDGKVQSITIDFHMQDKTVNRIQDIEVYLKGAKKLVADLESIKEQLQQTNEQTDELMKELGLPK